MYSADPLSRAKPQPPSRSPSVGARFRAGPAGQGIRKKTHFPNFSLQPIDIVKPPQTNVWKKLGKNLETRFCRSIFFES
jgi:hypothetical protein